MLVLLRTALTALFRSQDSYLLSNCLAALLCLGTAADDLGHYVSERVVTVVLRLSRKVIGGTLSSSGPSSDTFAQISVGTDENTGASINSAELLDTLKTLLLFVGTALRQGFLLPLLL